MMRGMQAIAVGCMLVLAWMPRAQAQDVYPAPRHEVYETRLPQAQTAQPKTSGVLDALYWEWEGAPRWAGGVNWGGNTFHGSLDVGINFFGSTLPETVRVPVELRFSRTEVSAARVFRRDQGYEDAGVGTFPGAAYDVSDPENPRRLNLCFVEAGGEGTPNLEWDPDGSLWGKREYVFIMYSDYDEKADRYAGFNGRAGGEMDILYAWWPRLEPDRTLLESAPATLHIKTTPILHFSGLPENGQADLSWTFAAGPEVQALNLYQSIADGPWTRVRTLAPNAQAVDLSGLENQTRYTYQLEAVDAAGQVLHVSPRVEVVPQVVSANMTRLGFWNHRADYGDVWGYTDAETGKEYALLCVRGEGLSVIDISGDRPVEVGFAPALTPRVDSKDVKVYTHYAVLINENASAQVIDLIDPTQPVTVATIDFPDNSGAHNAYIDGPYLYIAGAHTGAGVRIYDLTDPTQPQFIGEHHPKYYHDVYVRNDTLYAPAITRNEGIDVLDISNRANPVPITTINYPGSGAHNAVLSEDGRYLFVGDEIGSAGNHTRVFDVQDLEQVQKVADIVVNPNAVTHNSYVVGNRLYIAHYTEGVRVFDITDPTRPVALGHYDTYMGTEERFAGAWSVYPYFASGKLVVSDMQSGLFVLRMDGTPTGTMPLPTESALALEAFPMPFASASTLRYRLSETARVRLVVYDVLGRPVAVPVDAEQQPGLYHVPIQADDWSGGVYVARLTVDKAQGKPPETVVRKLLHIR